MKILFNMIISLGLATVGRSDATNEPTASSEVRSAELPQRVYTNLEDFFAKLRRNITPEKGGSEAQRLARFFKQNHIDIQKTGAMYLKFKPYKLLVKAPAADLDKIEALISKVQNEPPPPSRPSP